jgi:hypothetical protein
MLAVHDPAEAISVYTPLAAMDTLLIEGFCVGSEKLFGPDHE